MTEETTAFANGLIFDGVSAELREGCVRVAAGTIVEVALSVLWGGPERRAVFQGGTRAADQAARLTL